MIGAEINAKTTLPPGDQAAEVQTAERGERLSREDRQRLVLENLPEVRQIARHIHSRLPPHVPFDDLVHAGVLGLIDAVRKFDPAKNVRLKSYAHFRIRGAILDSLRGLDWGPRRLRKQGRLIEQARNDLLARLGRLPLECELAAQLGMQSRELQQILAELQSLKIESLQPQQERTWQGDALAARSNRVGDDPYELCVQLENAQLLAEALGRLDAKERRILRLYYFEEHTMKEVGKVLDLCESRVSQIISGALLDLRSRLETRLKSPKTDAQASITPLPGG